MKKLSAVFIIFILLLIINTTFAIEINKNGVTSEAKEVSLILNGENFEPTVGQMPPIIVEERTLVPVREVFEKLGGQVIWNDEERSVTIKFSNKLVSGELSRTIKLEIGSDSALVDGVTKSLDVPAEIINEKTMVPARFIAEAAYFDVQWHELTSTVYINRQRISVSNSLEENLYEVSEDGEIEIMLNRKLTPNEKLVVKVTFENKSIDYSNELIGKDCEFKLDVHNVVEDFGEEILGYESLRVDIYVESLETGELLTGGFNTMTTIVPLEKEMELFTNKADGEVLNEDDEIIFNATGSIAYSKGTLDYRVYHDEKLFMPGGFEDGAALKVKDIIETAFESGIDLYGEEIQFEIFFDNLMEDKTEGYKIYRYKISKGIVPIEEALVEAQLKDEVLPKENVNQSGDLYYEFFVIYNRALAKADVQVFSNKDEFVEVIEAKVGTEYEDDAQKYDIKSVRIRMKLKTNRTYTVCLRNVVDKAGNRIEDYEYSFDTESQIIAEYLESDGVEILYEKNDEIYAMIPVRVFASKLNGNVLWIDEEEKTVVEIDGCKMEFVIGSDVAKIDGADLKLPALVESKNGKTMVPANFLAKVLGYSWEIKPVRKMFGIYEK